MPLHGFWSYVMMWGECCLAALMQVLLCIYLSVYFTPLSLRSISLQGTITTTLTLTEGGGDIWFPRCRKLREWIMDFTHWNWMLFLNMGNCYRHAHSLYWRFEYWIIPISIPQSTTSNSMHKLRFFFLSNHVRNINLCIHLFFYLSFCLIVHVYVCLSV